MSRAIRWGILGTGGIAKTFAKGLSSLPDADLVAVGSRSRASADAFTNALTSGTFAVKAHAGYEALAHDPEVDIIYVATPHVFHCDNTMLCLEAGKAVLCEKPFSINEREAEAMIKLARSRRLFLMEAMWSRFLPATQKALELVKGGAIGELRMLQADFGFRAALDPQGRLFNPALGGGALLDIGVYTVSLASSLFGTPVEVVGLAHLGETGVDEQSAAVLKYPRGELALLSSAIRTRTPEEAILSGTAGSLRLHAPWWRPSALTVTRDGTEETTEVPYEGNGFQYEAAEAARCLREGRTESEGMPLEETLTIMRTLDTLRAGWGLRYPMEGE